MDAAAPNQLIEVGFETETTETAQPTAPLCDLIDLILNAYGLRRSAPPPEPPSIAGVPIDPAQVAAYEKARDLGLTYWALQKRPTTARRLNVGEVYRHGLDHEFALQDGRGDGVDD